MIEEGHRIHKSMRPAAQSLKLTQRWKGMTRPPEVDLSLLHTHTLACVPLYKTAIIIEEERRRKRKEGRKEEMKK